MSKPIRIVAVPGEGIGRGMMCPLAGRKAGDIDFFVVRDNAKGGYTAPGGPIFEGTERDLGGQASTTEMGKAIAARIGAPAH